MDSINRNQEEQNHADLHGGGAIAKIKELVGKAKTCFFRTKDGHARPMSVQKVDDEGTLWFLSARDSHKNLEVEDDPGVTVYFQGSPHSYFLELRGHASISADRAKIEELWEPVMKTWFTEGIEDSRITVIRFRPVEGYYWDTKHGMAVAGLKMLVGAAIGKTMDDSIEGALKI